MESPHPATATSIPSCNTGDRYENLYVLPMQAGVDDVTIGLDLAESRGSLGKITKWAENETPNRWGSIRIGTRGTFPGEYYDLLGRSKTFYDPRSHRLRVQAKLADQGLLAPLRGFQAACLDVLQRLALLGIVSYAPPVVTRLDTTIDLRFDSPVQGKSALLALLGVRMPGRLKAWTAGVPATTVYHGTEKGKRRARTYSRHRETGEPLYRVLRLEREKHWAWGEQPLEGLTPATMKATWDEHFLRLAPGPGIAKTDRDMEALLMTLREMVKEGTIGYGLLERVAAFSKLEAMGLAEDVYPPRILAERRREARKLGVRIGDGSMEPYDVDLGHLLTTAAGSETWDSD